MQRRINVSLSEEAVRLLDRMASKGDRSRFLEELVRRTAHDRVALRTRLKAGYIKRAERDREVAAEWDPVADEVWQRDARRR
jgi:metal-responsive CopG/Arc/MetJ family transcriptional regulator